MPCLRDPGRLPAELRRELGMLPNGPVMPAVDDVMSALPPKPADMQVGAPEVDAAREDLRELGPEPLPAQSGMLPPN